MRSRRTNSASTSLEREHLAPRTSPAPGPGPLEHQQATLFELLKRRQGCAVAFAELSDAGIEFPASVVSELEMCGAPVERRVVETGDVRMPGVRLDPEFDPCVPRASSTAPRSACCSSYVAGSGAAAKRRVWCARRDRRRGGCSR